MSNKSHKLELTWKGKENQPRLEAGTIILNEKFYNYDNIYP
jgi:hypothetical protein